MQRSGAWYEGTHKLRLIGETLCTLCTGTGSHTIAWVPPGLPDYTLRYATCGPGAATTCTLPWGGVGLVVRHIVYNSHTRIG